MIGNNDASEIVEIDFEVGHSSIIRSEVTTTHNPPRTHDWKVYLRSADVNGDLSCLIQRCVFHLHPEFPNNKRELKSTPFAIQETGYAGFHLPIEIYFNTKKEPKKFLIEYDLDLHRNIDGHPSRQKESYVQKYRCSFYNPDPEFRQKILAAGGSPSQSIMNSKTKENRNACRLIVVKIVDSGPITSNNTDTDESDIGEEQVSSQETISRHSPQQKRPISPVPTANSVNKKAKLEQSTNNIKKKQIQSVIKNDNASKAAMIIKKPKLVSHKSSSIVDEKPSKTLVIKESNQTIPANENIEISKPRSSTKLIKSQSTNDIKSSSQSITINIKKKESAPIPSKTKTVTNSQIVLKKSINKNPPKTSIKTEPTSISTVKSPPNVIIKHESFSQPSSTIISPSNSTTTVSINNLKKIPKKLVSTTVTDKRSRSSMPPSSLNQKSIQKDVPRQQSLSSKTQLNLKRDRSSSSVNNSNRPEKTQITKDHSTHQSSNSSQSNRLSLSPHKSSSKRQTPTPPKVTPSPSQSHYDPPINSTISTSSIHTSQPPILSSPSSTHVFQTKDNHIPAPMDIDQQNDGNSIQFSDKSNSPHEQILIQPNRISYSDQSDTNDSDNNEEEDLPTSLTNDDLRYKLIYIYKRFQLNSINDLIIFVRFFKRHQLIDITTLSMRKTTDEMFTYDLFSLSPSHVGELANDLGYTTTSIINSMEQ